MRETLSIGRSLIPLSFAFFFAVGGMTVRGVDLTPQPLGESSDVLAGVRVLSDQRFSLQAGKWGLCDIYTPAESHQQTDNPVVILVHGGGWMSGDKWMQEGYARLLARNGIVAVTINYRLAPAYRFPAQVDDVRAALVWTKKHAERLSIDPDRLGIFGYSAGGHLSSLLAALADEPLEVQSSASDWSTSDERWKQLPTIRAVCVGGPPCDFRAMPVDNHSLAFFLGGSRREKPDVYVAASPAAHISAGDPVTQIIHGESDLIVPIAGSRQFHEAQVSAGIDSRLEVMPKQGHMITFVNPRTSQKVLEFFQETLLKEDKQ